MNKIIPIFTIIYFSCSFSFCQNQVYAHSVVVSPGSLFIGRANFRYEKLRESHFTYGSRLEVSFLDKGFDKHIWVIPYGRLYFFNKEQTGLYSEAGLGYRLRYAKSADGFSDYRDIFKSSADARISLGTQWFAGKKSKIPFDISLGLNVDFQNKNVPDDVKIGTFLFGPLAALNLRIQTGFSF